MPQKARKPGAFFEVGHKVQLQPKSETPGSFWTGHYATIKRIEQRPDPTLCEDPEDWHRGPHWTLFWVEPDEHPELKEIPLRYRDLQPLTSRMSKQQLASYCQQRMRTERDEDRWNAYLHLIRYLNGEWPGPLVGHLTYLPGPRDIINVLITWSAEIRKQVRMIRGSNNTHELADTYEAQAQVYDELRELLTPTREAVLQGA